MGLHMTTGCLAFSIIGKSGDWGTLRQNTQVAAAYGSDLGYVLSKIWTNSLINDQDGTHHH